MTNPTVTDVTVNSATLGATVTGTGFTLIERGVVYSVSSTNPSPTVDGPGVSRVVSTPAAIGTYTVPVTGLVSETPYSFRGYVITNLGTLYSAPVSTFTTFPQPLVTVPTVTTPTSSGITSTSADLGGNVTNNGNSAIIERGVVYSVTAINGNPFIGGANVTKKIATGTTTGVFTVNASGLVANTTYSFKAYAINSVGTSHTLDVGTFTTSSAPVITSPTVANITSSFATLGGNVTSEGVTSEGGATVTQRGVVFSLTATNANPLIGGTGVSAFAAPTTGTGVFTVNATNLSSGKNYSFKSYAINSVGTSYTTVGTFTTAAAVATITSPTVANITATTATLGGTVASDTTVSERGVVYTLDPNIAPVLGGPGVTKKTATGTTGAFTVGVTGLSSATSYYFRAYATNTVGTSYSVTSTFATNPVQLLGLALMEWVPAPQQPQVQALQLQAFSLEEPQPAQLQTFAVEEPQPTAVVESPQVVPGFVYYKADVEAIDPMSYQIETSSDNREWLPINENDWIVTETSAEIRATWVSTLVSPPTRIFFRIRSDIQ